ncbi:hydrogenase maturation nickel metallochaperone HypA [Candidatus Aerophobetes bacterium]|nr:hydrogenase maturation nickel metallochaperone HypA [Candidatus Aerophobetes bacterium]
MHDFSISRQIASEVIKRANEKKASQVLEIKLKIGELTHLNPEQISFWLKELFKDTLAEQANIKIEKVPVSLQCKKCSYQGKIEIEEKFYYPPLLNFIFCPHCKSEKIKIKSGDECLLERIKIKR